MVIGVGASEVRVRDQAPLHAGNVEFEAGWDFARLVAALNDRVYFWPGTADSPIEYGLRHLGRYLSESPAIIKIPTRSLFAINPAPLFCGYNSGSPRCSGGRKSPRGSTTFQSGANCTLGASDVVEVTFEEVARLPSEAEVLLMDSWCPIAATYGQQRQAEPSATANSGVMKAFPDV